MNRNNQVRPNGLNGVRRGAGTDVRGRSNVNHRTKPGSQSGKAVRQYPQNNKAKKKKNRYSKEQLRQIKEQKAYLRAEKKKLFLNKLKSKLVFAGKILLASLALAIVFIILYGVIMVIRVFSGNSTDYDCKYIIGEYTDKYTEKEYKQSYLVQDDVPYINIDDLVEYCNLSVTGDKNETKIIIHGDTDSYVGFENGNSNIYINGFRYRLNSPAIKRDGSMWIPMDFINKYMNEVDASYDTESHTLMVKRVFTDECAKVIEQYEERKKDKDKSNDINISAIKLEYKSISFSAMPHSTTDNIKENSLSDYISYLTDPVRLAEEAEAQRKALEEAQRAEAEAIAAAAAAKQQ